MCKVYCMEKIAQLVKKFKLQKMKNSGNNDMLDRPIDVKKIDFFIENEDCCKFCKFFLENQN